MTALTTLESRLANEILRDPNNRVRPISTLDYALNSAKDHVQSELQSLVADKQSTSNTVSGTQEYDLPSDFGKLKVATYEGTPLQKVELDWLRRDYTTFTNGTPIYYYLRPGIIGLHPIPDAVGEIYMLYSRTLATMTSAQDSEAPTSLDNAILYKAASLCFKQVGRADMGAIWDVEYEKEMNKARINLAADFNLTM